MIMELLEKITAVEVMMMRSESKEAKAYYQELILDLKNEIKLCMEADHEKAQMDVSNMEQNVSGVQISQEG